MSGDELEQGYWRAYREFYRGGTSPAARRRTAASSPGLRHFAYASGWKKFEPLWDLVIRARHAGAMLPVLEGILSEFGQRPASSAAGSPATSARHAQPKVIPLREERTV